ncbi:tRNA (guanine(26)-N(2))-dimethyltransferase-like isoform X1 [Epargyreus clarus]|uniref:tRNA (guanine(26)-N(2))-dimethyltransferase-like isoform X1 n=1 Tax=Epargyreus clarus TaxID=520877 RepID=UPI003C2F8077
MTYFLKLRQFTAFFKRLFKMEMIDIEVDPERWKYKNIKEGCAVMRLKTDRVFYNPVQEFNRDMSIAVLAVFTKKYKQEQLEKAEKKAKGQILEDKKGDESLTHERVAPKVEQAHVPITILEALSATGLRSIRYAREVPNVTKIIANDISEQAVETIKDNIEYNYVGHLVEVSHDDACMLMYKHKHPLKRFTAIDLDPYGCPSIFLDSAVQSVADGGLLLVTATDMAVLTGNLPDTCYAKYGAISLRTQSCHEMALRILLQCIEQHANRYTRYIVPLLSMSVDFYIRVFVEVRSGAIHCKKSASKMSMVYHCVGCDTVTLQPLSANPSPSNPDQEKSYLPPAPPVGEFCTHCNQRHRLGGPIWSAPIHDEEFVEDVMKYVEKSMNVLGTARRIEGLLAVVREELPAPLYCTLDRLCGAVHLGSMPMRLVRSALLNGGYKVSYSHTSRLSVKTDAPARFLWDIVRSWEKQKPLKPAKLEADPVAKYILSQEITSKVDLTMRPDANPESRKVGKLLFQFNPTPHYGPGSRAAIKVGERRAKALKNQNKKKGPFNENKRHHSPWASHTPSKKLAVSTLRIYVGSDDDTDSKPKEEIQEKQPDTVKENENQ